MDGVEKKYLKEFCEKRIQVKLNLKNGKFFTGFIIELGDQSLLFLDKYKTKIPFDLDGISYAEPTRIKEEDYNGRN